MRRTETIKPSDLFDSEMLKLDQPCLVVISGREIGRRYLIDQEKMIVGRGNDSHILLKEKNVSRRHACIVKTQDNIIIEDLKSKNDTFVNGEKIISQKLQEGDLITVGTIVLKFSVHSELDKRFCEEVYDAKFDDLTGLTSRKFFQKYMVLEFARAKRYQHDISLLICDLDNFKQINDQYGHHAGDQVLKTVGTTITSCIRKDVDIPVRYGGEEFVILLPEASLSSAQKVGEKIRKGIENLTVDYNNNDIRLTVSIGISAKSENVSNPLELILKADQKLYFAKQKGKNRVEA